MLPATTGSVCLPCCITACTQALIWAPLMLTASLRRCLSKYNYQQKVCAKEVEDLVRCCRTLPSPAGSLHCRGFMHLIKAREEEESKSKGTDAEEQHG